MRSVGLILMAGVTLAAVAAYGQTAPAASNAPVVLPTIDIFSSTPLSGTGVDVDKVPSAVTSIDSRQISRQRSANIVNSVAATTPGVDVQSVSGNAFQPDVSFRGFDASPISGTPQGLAIYQNGMRVNEAYGDTVNWDLIPTSAVRDIDVISNNPAFGLNALGGALSVRMKDGFSFQGVSVDVMGGSNGRLQSSFQWGQQIGPWATYLAVEAAHDSGYRKASASEIRRLYGDIGYRGDKAELHLNMGAASNVFGATASAPAELLALSWSNVYTTPQTSANQVGYVNASLHVEATPTWSFDGTAYVRSIYQRTIDGNSTNVQPCANPAFLCFGDTVTPANGLDGLQLANPFGPADTLGEIDRTSTQTTSVGLTGQATNVDKLWGHDNHFVLGASLDYGVTNFGASAEIGVIQPDFSLTGSGISLGPSGNPTSAGPVALRTRNLYTGLYALDTFDVTPALSISVGGRLNLAGIRLEDQLGTQLNGDSSFWRFNPMIGATYKFSSDLTAYAGYSEANRAPTPLELGCADPAHPCILASFLVSDPPLKQVVARTYEAGLRGSHDYGEAVGRLGWKLGVFRTDSENDILNVPDPLQAGFGYFTNVGATRRQGLEAEVNFKADKFSLYGSYAYTDATFRNALTLASNSPAADANGYIYIQPGNQLPMVPRQRLKLGGDYRVTNDVKVGVDVLAVGPQYFAGDGSNQLPQLPGYAVVSADASWQVAKTVQLYLRAENLLGQSYYTYGAFFDTGAIPNFGNGGAPFTDPRSLSPAQPRSIYAGIRATF